MQCALYITVMHVQCMHCVVLILSFSVAHRCAVLSPIFEGVRGEGSNGAWEYLGRTPSPRGGAPGWDRVNTAL